MPLDRNGAQDHFWGNIGSLRLEHSAANPLSTDISTAQTILRMSHLARSQAFSAPINEAVNAATASLPDGASDRAIAEAIFWWVKANVKFEEDEQVMFEHLGVPADELDKELLISPVALLQMPQPTGDCDDFSMLMAAMLLNMRMKVWFVTIACDEEIPGKFSHVFVATVDEYGRKIYLDASHGPFPGWRRKQVYREKEWIV